MKTKFPYKCIIKQLKRSFIPTMIDYENKQVWWQKGQASENGEWLDFRDVEFKKINSFINLSKKIHL